jgi:hypothetical protein
MSLASSSCFAIRCSAIRWRLVGLPESSGERIRRFPCRYYSTIILHAHISPGGRTIPRWWSQFTDVVSPHRHIIKQDIRTLTAHCLYLIVTHSAFTGWYVWSFLVQNYFWNCEFLGIW